MLTAVREGYFPAGYGQRLPAGQGRPITVTANSSLFAELRLRHKGVLTGRVLDENGVGVAGVPVHAYRARLPLRPAATGNSDDRGIYRIYGLDPGKYWVRTAPHVLDDNSGWGPSFGPQSREVEHARVHTVNVDVETTYADISPEPGALYNIRGEITCERPGLIHVVVSSETVTRTTQTYCAFNPGGYAVQGLPGGTYEIFAESQDLSASAFLELSINRHMEGINLNLRRSPAVEILVSGAAASEVKLFGRRQNLGANNPVAQIPVPRAVLAAGLWDLRAEVSPGFFVESIENVRGGTRRARSYVADDWYEVHIDPRFPGPIRVRVSDQAGRISGRILEQDKPVAGAPVFLWPVSDVNRRSVVRSREVHVVRGWRLSLRQPSTRRISRDSQLRRL